MTLIAEGSYPERPWVDWQPNAINKHTAFFESRKNKKMGAAMPQTAEQHLHPNLYLTGATALSLPSQTSGLPALWHSSAIGNPKTWQMAGTHITDTRALLGTSYLWDATEEIEKHGIFVNQIWAATHERAVFDLLYCFCERRGTAVPNILSSDIDDVADLQQVVGWIDQFNACISESGRIRMMQWLGRV